MAEGHQIDFADYFQRVHGSLPYDKYLFDNGELRRVLMSLPGRRVGFTNADAAHTERVLKALGIEECFHQLLTFETFNPIPISSGVRCKPNVDVFAEALKLAHVVDPARVVFLDDSSTNIKVAKALGMHTVFVGSVEKCEGADEAVHELQGIVHCAPHLLQENVVRFRGGKEIMREYSR